MCENLALEIFSTVSKPNGWKVILVYIGVLYWSLLTYVGFSQLLRNDLVRCNMVGFSPTRQLFSNHASRTRSVSNFRTLNPYVWKLFNVNV